MAGEELSPFEGVEEILDGEVVEERDDFKIETWRDGIDFKQTIQIEIEEGWYQRVDGEAWEQLNACITELQRLGRL